jgi:hypothetical protein
MQGGPAVARRFVREKTLSEMIGVPVTTLRRDRMRNPPRFPYFKQKGTIFYDPEEIIELITAGRRGDRAALRVADVSITPSGRGGVRV